LIFEGFANFEQTIPRARGSTRKLTSKEQNIPTCVPQGRERFSRCCAWFADELKQITSTLQVPGLQVLALLPREAMAVKSSRMKRYHGTLKWASFQSATSSLGRVGSRCGVRRRGGENGVQNEKRLVCCGSSLTCSIFCYRRRQAGKSIISLYTEPPRKRRLYVYAFRH
jgi:hypothetical protein